MGKRIVRRKATLVVYDGRNSGVLRRFQNAAKKRFPMRILRASEAFVSLKTADYHAVVVLIDSTRDRLSCIETIRAIAPDIAIKVWVGANPLSTPNVSIAYDERTLPESVIGEYVMRDTSH